MQLWVEFMNSRSKYNLNLLIKYSGVIGYLTFMGIFITPETSWPALAGGMIVLTFTEVLDIFVGKPIK